MLPPSLLSKVRLLPSSSFPFIRQVCRSIGSFIQGSDSIKIKWKSIPNSEETEFHYVWLRDSCPCDKCISPTKSLRLQDPLLLTTDIKPVAVSQNSNQSLTISWLDGHQSEFTADWLKRNAYDGTIDTPYDKRVPFTRDVRQDAVLWGEEIASNPPRITYQEIMESDENFLKWNSLLELYGFCFVYETPQDIQSMRNLFNKIGVVRNTFYGDLYMVGKRNSSTGTDNTEDDPVYSSAPVSLHTDATYFLTEVPALQVFQLLSFAGTELPINVLTDGFKVAERVRERSEYHYQLLTRIPFPYRYEVDNEIKQYSSHRFFNIQPHTGKLVGVRNCDIRRMITNSNCYHELKEYDPKATMMDLYDAMNTFYKALYTDELGYKFQLKIGTALFTDNYRVLHARTAHDGERQLRGGYINLEDWRSKVMAAKDRLAALRKTEQKKNL